MMGGSTLTIPFFRSVSLLDIKKRIARQRNDLMLKPPSGFHTRAAKSLRFPERVVRSI